MRELNLLECLETSPNISQSTMAKQVGLTPAMVNTYIRRFQSEGLLSTEELSRGMAYHLTAKGRDRLQYHRVTFRAELVRMIQAARKLFQGYFRDLARDGICSVVLYGAGETAEVALDALDGTNIVQVLAVIDDDPTKQGSPLRGVPVVSAGAIAQLNPQAVVITSVVFASQIRDRIGEEFQPAIRVVSLTELDIRSPEGGA